MTEEKYDKLRASFLEVLEDLVRFRGTEPMVARIYALVVLSPKPLTQEEISTKTGYSRSQISRYLSNLEQRGMIRKESVPGSRTQLYGGGAKPFFENFRRGIDISERFVKGKVRDIENILTEYENLSPEERETPEAQRLKEVVTVFNAWFLSYLELMTEFNTRFNEKMDELERKLFPL